MKIRCPFAPPHQQSSGRSRSARSAAPTHTKQPPVTRPPPLSHNVTRASTLSMAFTACRIAAPLGVALPPRGRAGAFAVVQCGSNKISRGVVAVRATSSGETSVETPEFVRAVQDAWDKVEDKYAVSAIGVAGIVALWTAIGAIKAIDKLPILPGVLEIVGLGYTGWFTYRNLIFQPDREALFSKIESIYKEIIGNSK